VSGRPESACWSGRAREEWPSQPAALRSSHSVSASRPIVGLGASRLYRGMHYPSDVLVGALGGALWLLLVIKTLLPRQGTEESDDEDPAVGVNRS